MGKNSPQRKFISNNKGIVLIFLYLILAVLTILFAAFMSRSINENQATLRNRDVVEAYALAESGVDLVSRDLFEAFNTYFLAQGSIAAAFSWFDDLPNATKYVLPVNSALGNGIFTVSITNVDTSVSGQRDVTLVSTGVVNNITKQATMVIRYALLSSQVFDNVYFINNFGWMIGSTIIINGELRSNGNFYFDKNPTVNGDIHAAANPELGAAGDITGSTKNDTINYYRTTYGDRTRPTNPSADPQDINSDGKLETFPYQGGFDGSARFPNEDPVPLPYLGNLQIYKDLAVSKNGKLSQGASLLVNNVYEGKYMILEGTDADPLVINGPVVITGDVIIKGVVTGQGTIYAGRNVHITGNVTYKNPPSWVKPDTNTAATDAANESKDFLGLIARGSVIVGDYTSGEFNQCEKYLEPPFTQDYMVDVADADLGYVSYYSGGKPYFDGDYLDYDGGQKIDDKGKNAGKRRYYESTLDDTWFKKLCGASFVDKVDAVCYTNHAFSGRVGQLVVNGTMVARDEAVVFDGKLTINHDLRAKTSNMGTELNLPRGLAQPLTVYKKVD